MNFQTYWTDAENAQSRLNTLAEETAVLKRTQGEAIKKLTEMIAPHCEQAVARYNQQGGSQIKIKQNGIDFINSESKTVNLNVTIYDIRGYEFDEWFNSVAEIESVFGSKLRPILDPIFKANDIPLTLGRIKVPNSYLIK